MSVSSAVVVVVSREQSALGDAPDPATNKLHGLDLEVADRTRYGQTEGRHDPAIRRLGSIETKEARAVSETSTVPSRCDAKPLKAPQKPQTLPVRHRVGVKCVCVRVGVCKFGAKNSRTCVFCKLTPRQVSKCPCVSELLDVQGPSHAVLRTNIPQKVAPPFSRFRVLSILCAAAAQQVLTAGWMDGWMDHGGRGLLRASMARTEWNGVAPHACPFQYVCCLHVYLASVVDSCRMCSIRGVR